MQKFLFNTDLDPSLKDEPEKPSFSEEEIEAAKQAARMEGHSQGFTEASEGLNRQVTLLLDGLNNQILSLGQNLQQLEAQKNKDAAQLALAITQKLLPDYCSRHGTKEIEALIEDCLNHSGEEPRLVVRLSETMMEQLKLSIDQMALRNGYEGRIILIADANLTDLDCLVEWADGGAERNIAKLWQEITLKIDRIIPGSLDKPDLLALQKNALEAKLKAEQQAKSDFATPSLPENSPRRAPSNMGLPDAFKESDLEETPSSEATPETDTQDPASPFPDPSEEETPPETLSEPSQEEHLSEDPKDETP